MKDRREQLVEVLTNYVLQEIDKSTQVVNLNTWGDLKKLLNQVSTKKNISKAAKIGASAAVDLLPGGGTVKSGYDIIKAFYYGKNKTKKDTWLNKLTIDPRVAQIVDDTVEDSFIQYLYDEVKKKKDSEPLPRDFSIDDVLSNFLQAKFDRRTITGYK